MSPSAMMDLSTVSEPLLCKSILMSLPAEILFSSPLFTSVPTISTSFPTSRSAGSLAVLNITS